MSPRPSTRLYPNWQRECVESAFSGRSSRPRRTNFSLQLRYASGEAARLSIGREGFDLPTERQFLKTTGCSSVRPELLPWKQEAVGSNPTALTILRLRKVVRGGAQPVSKAGPTSGSRVRLLHLPPLQTAVIRRCCARVGWALASPRRCKRPASAVVVQFHPYPPTPRWLQDG